MPENALDPDVVNLTKAIRKTESNDNFTIRGASGEFGAYQYTPDTWNGVAKKYGINVPLEQASPRQQNEVTYRRVKEWKDAGYNVGQIASMWNAGEGRPNAYKENWKGVNSYGVAYDTPAYATKVATAYQSIKATQQPAQALGQAVAQGVETTDPIQRVAQGQAAFPSQQGDSVGTSLLKYGGNLPGSTYNLARNVIAPVNPFDRENPLNIGQNIYESGVALKDIYSNRGAIQGTKDIIGGFGRTIGKGINFLDDKLSGAFRMTQERGLGGALAEGTGRLAEAAINDPTLVPSLLYSPRALGGRDLISDVASPVTRPAAKIGEAITERADDATVAKREAALKEVDQANNARVAAEAANPDRWRAARRTAAESDVLTKAGVIDENGKIVGAVEAAKAFRKTEIGKADSVVAKLLERERVGIPLEAVEREITRTVKEALEGAELMTALNKIKREMNGLRLKHKDGRILLKDVHRLKVKTQPLSKDYLRPQSARYNKQLARGYKETVEKYSKENIREINAEIQKYLDASDYIAGLQGKYVDSGKLGKMVARAGGAVTGAVVGGAIGGIPGVIGGSIAGGAASSKLAGRAAKNKFGKATKRPSKPNKVLQDAVKRATEDREQLALPPARPKKPLALPPGNPTGQNGPNIPLRPARSMEKGVEKLPFLDSLDEKVLKKMAEEPLEIPDELKKYLNISDDVEEVSVKAKNELPNELEEKLLVLELKKEALDQHPAKNLAKYAATRGEFKGALPEVLGRSKGKFKNKGDDLAKTEGFDSSEEAREAYLDYVKQREDFKAQSKEVMAEIKEYKAKNKKPGKARQLLNAAKENLKNPQLRQGGYSLNKPKVIGAPASKVQKSSSLNSTPQKLGVANPAQNLADAKQGLKEAKGLSPSDIIAKNPDINMKRDTPVTDVYGKKSVIPAGEALTPYELKGNKVLLQDGETYIVSKNQWQNVKGQAISGEATEFAPELKGTIETVKGGTNKSVQELEKEAKLRKKQAEKDLESKGYLVEEDMGGDAYITDKDGELLEYDDLPDDIRALYDSWSNDYVDLQTPEKLLPTKYSQYTLDGGENYREILIQAPENLKKGEYGTDVIDKTQTYRSSHWSEPNVISHIRMNERTVDGKKYAFMEELQSDWARDARSKEGIPNNPLLKDWQIPTTKRALIEAVDSGADRFAWINGEQTSARYNLATHVDEVDWKTTKNAIVPKGSKYIKIKAKGGNGVDVEVDHNGVITMSSRVGQGADWQGKKLDEVLGKGLADKIMEKETGTLSGEGLSFGGEWAKNLYDRQVRDIVKKLTSAEVKTVDMGLGDGNKKGRQFSPVNNLAQDIKPNEIGTKYKVGDVINNNDSTKYGQYIITDVLGNGKFKAVTKNDYEKQYEVVLTPNNRDGNYGKYMFRDKTFADKSPRRGVFFESKSEAEAHMKQVIEDSKETFDISTPTAVQQYIELTPEVKARIKGEAFLAKKPSGISPVNASELKR